MTVPDKREWSLVSREKFEEYILESKRLVDLAKENKIGLFGAAMAGVAFIREAVATMGGDVEWWVRLIRTGELDSFWADDVNKIGQQPKGEQ